MGPVQPERDQPLIEQLLQLGHGPQRLVLDMTAAAVRAAPGIAGGELAEQRGDRPEVPLDVAFLRSAAQVGGLDGDAQVPAGGPERGRDEHAAVVDHDGVRDDHRPGGGMLQPLVDREQPLIGQHRMGHLQRLGPARPHRLRGQGAGQQHARVDRLRRGAQHRGGHHPGGDVDHAGQLDPAGNAVVQQHQHVQRGGVDLHDLARRRRRQRPEHALRPPGQRPAGRCRARSCAGRATACRTAGRTSGPTARRRHSRPRRGSPSSARSRTPPSGRTPRPPPRSPAASHRRPARRPGRRPHPPGRPAVDQPGQAVCLPPLAAVLDRAGRDRRPAADSSAAFALSRSVRLVRSGSYCGFGRAPAGASGRSP